ncbi:MAG: isoleucine--tRNA ligase [Promethearchaeota archaeon]
MSKKVVGKLEKRYQPQKLEETVLEFWKKKNIYERAKHQNIGREKFYFLDGPPYVTNPIHVGTAWNKCLKDTICRYKRINRYEVRAQPGYDCHGLPIEVMVEKKLNLKTKKDIETLGVDRFLEECMTFATTNERVLARQFEDLGIWMDWDAPYMTIHSKYMEAAWFLIKRAYEQDLLGQSQRVVHWCWRCETVLSGYEVTDEYREIRDPGIYVMFPVAEEEDEKDTYFVIYTTTPWTLPGNTGIMVHPDKQYAKVQTSKGKLILAYDLVDEVMEAAGIDYDLLSVFQGSELVETRYRNPLEDQVTLQRKFENSNRVVASREFVTIQEGTSGLVHVAPGHGEEDFHVGIEKGLPRLSPVDDTGRLMEGTGKYQGMFVKDADSTITKDIEDKGLMLMTTEITHRYPHCWRCKSPLIMRTTNQWIIEVTKKKNELLKANERINWVPEWAGSRRYRNWLENLRDWVISRQRFWGIPLPIWICTNCNEIEVIGSVKELRSRVEGLPESLDLHKPTMDRIKLSCTCGGEKSRVDDICDVWLDSGVATFADLHFPHTTEHFEKWYPADFILEGHDQTRGWFHTLLLSGIVAFGDNPYRNVVMHGFTLDENGEKMSKSEGNFVAPEDIIAQYGRDALRTYVLGSTMWQDLRFVWNEMKQAQKDLGVIWNVYLFASNYMSLDEFEPTKYTLSKIEKTLLPEDRWILSQLQTVVASTTEYLDKYEIHEGIRVVMNFILNDVSRWYVKIIRKRVWIESGDPEKIAAYTTLFQVLKTVLILLTPYLPFLTEHIYQNVLKPAEPNSVPSIHMLDWPKSQTEWKDKEREELMKVAREVISASISARQSVKPPIKIRQPLKTLIILSDSKNIEKTLFLFEKLILEQANVSEITIEKLSKEKDFISLEIIPNLQELGPKFKEKVNEIITYLKTLDPMVVMDTLTQNDSIELNIEGEKVIIRKTDVAFREHSIEPWQTAKIPEGRIILNTKITADLAAEGITRDLVRRLQSMRKDLDLTETQPVLVEIQVETPEQLIALQERESYIATEVRAHKIRIGTENLHKTTNGLLKEWKLGKEAFKLQITP